MLSAGLWKRPDFLKLWTGQTVSLFGSQLTSLALPMTAVWALSATPMQLGALGVAQSAPFLLMALFAGVLIDRVERRPVLIVADVARGLLLGYIPLAAALGILRIEHLYVVTFLLASFALVFDIAHVAFLSSIVRRHELVEGNSKLQVSSSLASIVGPGLAGFLLQLVSGPVVIVGDAVSFLVSAAMLGAIRRPEARTSSRRQQGSTLREIREGLALVWASPMLRSIAVRNAVFNVFASFPAIYLLFLTQELKLPAAAVGALFAVSGVGALLGALVAGPAARRLGWGPAIIGGALAEGLAGLIAPLAIGPLSLQLALLAAGQLIVGAGGLIYGINQISLRQALTPEELHGRVNATIRFIVFGAAPLGSLLGGLLAEAIGLRSTLVVAGVGMAASSLCILHSPVRSIQAPPLVPSSLAGDG